MVTNLGNGFRYGSAHNCTQEQNPQTGNWTKRDTQTGRFIAQKSGGHPSRITRTRWTAGASASVVTFTGGGAF